MQFDLQVWLKVGAYTGSGLAIGLGAIGAAIGEGHAAAQANLAISRNPSLSGDIFKTMLVGQAIAESASIFALVVALMLLFTGFPAHSFINVWAVFSAGIWRRQAVSLVKLMHQQGTSASIQTEATSCEFGKIDASTRN